MYINIRICPRVYACACVHMHTHIVSKVEYTTTLHTGVCVLILKVLSIKYSKQF